MAHLYVNNLRTELSSGVLHTDTVIPVASTSNFPTLGVGDWFYMTISSVYGVTESAWEVVKVTGYTTTEITCVRAQDGTTAKVWPINSSISCRTVAGDMRILEEFKDSKGIANGVASLGADAKLVPEQVPTVLQADSLKVARTIALDGDVTGSATFDGSANATITAVVGNDSHNHTLSTITSWPVGVDTTKINYLTNVSSDIQSQLAGKASSAHTHNLDDLTDVVITSATTNDTLKYNGTTWVNTQPVTISHGALSGLTIDDHSQYYNQARGDARYSQLAHTHTISSITDWPAAVTMTEIGYVGGVTSAIQTQINSKASLNSPALTGTPTAPTAVANTNTTQLATTAFVEAATAPAQLLTDIKTVDGTGSGLDADLLDGLDSTAFAAASHTHTYNLDSLSDVVITTPSSGQVVSYNGSNWINSAPAGGSAGVATYVETITAEKTITEEQAGTWVITTSTDYFVNIPASPTTDIVYTIVNSATSTASTARLNVRCSGDSAAAFLSLESGQYATFVFELISNKWICYLGNGTAVVTRTATNTFNPISIVSIGYSANGSNNGVAIGYSANGSNNGVAVGFSANGSNNGVAIGYNASCINSSYGSAIGYYAKPRRYGGFARSGDHLSTSKLHIEEVHWAGTTTSSTATELFLHGVSANRCTILANSSVAFTIRVIGTIPATPQVLDVELKGTISRNGSNSTVIIGSVTSTTISNNFTSASVSVTADDTSESLKLTVTGETGKTITWGAVGTLVDCRSVGAS